MSCRKKAMIRAERLEELVWNEVAAGQFPQLLLQAYWNIHEPYHRMKVYETPQR